ncbi:hypothetical protein RclHR1_13110001 [Rhizophagus clarus]|uniref:Uncharacterized protein n=1 Tax=Rhizophagus clarus TaxID=94130 RepID=A0A2Z6R1X0_9GLOM|nr:hypothetical protein RclHR1_13110001 [Rhizophagus clarus]
MDFTTQETIHSEPKWFFKHRKEDISRHINFLVRDLMLDNKGFFNQVEMDDELLKAFLLENANIMQKVEAPKSIPHPIQHQSDSMNLDDSQGDTSGIVPSTPHRPNPITPPATPLSRVQKKLAKKKLKKLQRQQQQQDENPFIVPSRPSHEQTPSGSKVVTINNVPPQQATSSKSNDNNKPSEQSTITSEKKRKQEHLADNYNNSNLILTGYCPQQEEQAQLTRCHKKYLSARARLIPNHECLKAYNGGEWTVGLGDIPVRWFPASWNLSERKQREKFQAVITNIPADMTESTLFPNSTPSRFIAESGIKSFKVIKESLEQRKLIGYFATWDQASKCISTPQLWNDVSLS